MDVYNELFGNKIIKPFLRELLAVNDIITSSLPVSHMAITGSLFVVKRLILSKLESNLFKLKLLCCDGERLIVVLIPNSLCFEHSSNCQLNVGWVFVPHKFIIARCSVGDPSQNTDLTVCFYSIQIQIIFSPCLAINKMGQKHLYFTITQNSLTCDPMLSKDAFQQLVHVNSPSKLKRSLTQEPKFDFTCELSRLSNYSTNASLSNKTIIINSPLYVPQNSPENVLPEQPTDSVSVGNSVPRSDDKFLRIKSADSGSSAEDILLVEPTEIRECAETSHIDYVPMKLNTECMPKPLSAFSEPLSHNKNVNMTTQQPKNNNESSINVTASEDVQHPMPGSIAKATIDTGKSHFKVNNYSDSKDGLINEKGCERSQCNSSSSAEKALKKDVGCSRRSSELLANEFELIIPPNLPVHCSSGSSNGSSTRSLLNLLSDNSTDLVNNAPMCNNITSNKVSTQSDLSVEDKGQKSTVELDVHNEPLKVIDVHTSKVNSVGHSIEPNINYIPAVSNHSKNLIPCCTNLTKVQKKKGPYCRSAAARRLRSEKFTGFQLLLKCKTLEI